MHANKQTLDVENAERDKRIVLGWREWVTLPDLCLPAIKAKVDTGAKTSALHAFEVEKYRHDGLDFVRFGMHPLQKTNDLIVKCEARLIDERLVSDSGGHSEMRLVIETELVICDYRWLVEFTLTDRDSMRFRMLLGRGAMENRAVVDPDASFLCGRLDASALY